MLDCWNDDNIWRPTSAIIVHKLEALLNNGGVLGIGIMQILLVKMKVGKMLCALYVLCA